MNNCLDHCLKETRGSNNNFFTLIFVGTLTLFYLVDVVHLIMRVHSICKHKKTKNLSKQDLIPYTKKLNIYNFIFFVHIYYYKPKKKKKAV